MSGMFMSIKTNAGCNSDAAATPLVPPLASPTTSNPSVMSTTIRATSRNGTWSSTISTVTVGITAEHPAAPAAAES